MQGWLASYPESNQHPVATHHENMVAELSYLMADAMLKARGGSMSKQGIRSLIYCLLICGVIWTALIIKILHVTGVFNG
ncbi:Uncharacterised protein [Klebsiella pneumoniae]|nr:Uncharacterised protein [Klebsiella pneumoniae]